MSTRYITIDFFYSFNVVYRLFASMNVRNNFDDDNNIITISVNTHQEDVTSVLLSTE